ncbi:MAG: IclR family transcriptional regulator [Clostridia bacterium]|jgi:DNA-binding IclR family transcriptional regulator|nr:IclR family transcriptional regulator [Clostridia bacterium]
MEKQEPHVPSVASSLEIMEWLAKDENKNATLTEISSRLHLSKSTCLRILKTLTMKGYLTYNTTSKKYSLGYSLIPLGTRAQEINDSIGKMIAYLPKVAEDTGVTAVLVKRINDKLMYVAKQEPPQKVRLTVTVGDTFPINVGALGKCFLAYLDVATRQDLLNKMTKNGMLPRYTENSLSDPATLLEQIERIRDEGIAQSNGEYNAGIMAIACPIFDAQNKIILALGGFMPNPPQAKEEMELLQNMIKCHASKMSELGL